MIPASLPIRIYRGDDFSLVIRMKDSVDNSYVNLAGMTGRGQIRPDALSTTILADFVVSIMEQVTTPGGVLIELSPTVTASLPLSGGVYDIEIYNTERTWVKTPVAGSVEVIAEVTRTDGV